MSFERDWKGCWGVLQLVLRDLLGSWGSIGIMEKKMETQGIIGIYRGLYRVRGLEHVFFFCGFWSAWDFCQDNFQVLTRRPRTLGPYAFRAQAKVQGLRFRV